jgi:uncharacterized membrane protein
MTAVLTLRSKTVFAGGILTGLGLSAYAFGFWIWRMIEYEFHHMFIMGVSKPRVFTAIVLFPAAVIAIGIWLATHGSKEA